MAALTDAQVAEIEARAADEINIGRTLADIGKRWAAAEEDRDALLADRAAYRDVAAALERADAENERLRADAAAEQAEREAAEVRADRAEARMERLRAALINLRWRDADGGPCWCASPLDVMRHSISCEAARAALAHD